ncbi:MAG TPA: biotin/lipoyl-containing protein, partial [Nitrososphaera sp.]|nr:biotin/lipoyl-containing protein [Nitrososphaera sp.]
MTEGVIAAWHKKVGDNVKKGDLLAEVETDKATMELESYKDGTLLHIGTDKGGKLQVNDLLAIIGAPGEDISSLLKGGGGEQPAAEAPKKEEPKQEKQAQPQAEQKAAPAASGESLDLGSMQEVILMPRLSDTMTEGVIAEWHKKVGDTVKKGDLLADVETDKATMELESYKEGKLLYVGAKKGDKVPVNSLLCVIGEEGKVDLDKIVAASKGGGAVESKSAQQSQPAQVAQQGQPAQQAQPETQQAAAATGTNGRVKASPLAKKLASEKGIDISRVPGSGDGGRITKRDVDNYTPSAGQQQGAARQTTPAAAQGQVSFEEVPVSQMRKVIAKRLGESKFSAPHFYLTMAINMDRAVESRAKLNEISPVKIS